MTAATPIPYSEGALALAMALKFLRNFPDNGQARQAADEALRRVDFEAFAAAHSAAAPPR